MTLSPNVRRLLAVLTGLVLVVMYAPLMIVVINSFNESQSFTWPPSGLTLDWWVRAFNSDGARSAVVTSVQAAAAATVIALVLGTLMAMALQRYEFFGKNSVNLLVILPIALPGIVTGIALNNAFRGILGLQLTLLTVIIAHATFCIVTVFNNVQARLRRVGGNLEEVTTFTAGAGVKTLPIWILDNLFRPNQAPIVNVVAVVLILVSIVPIWFAQKLSGDTEALR